MVWGESTMEVSEGVEGEVRRIWEEALEARRREGKKLFDGPMVRLEGWEVDGDRLRITVSKTSYRYFYVLHMVRTDLREAHPRAAANPVGISAALVTADGQLLLGRRSDRVAYYPGRIHPFAGALEPGDLEGGVGGVFNGAVRELGEEVNVRAEELMGLRLLGFAQDANLRQPEAIVACRCVLRAEEIVGRLDPAEHEGVVVVRARGEEIGKLLEGERLLTPVCRAALGMWVEAEGV
jgi:8-oxo-dGTP pyrophosphatase MutT (NUDIX family)